MKTRIRRAATVLLLLALLVHGAGTARAAEPTAIAPFIDAQTVAVGYASVDALANALAPDGGLAQWLHDAPVEESHALAGALQQAGVREAYVVVSTSYLYAAPVAIVLPLAEGATPGPAQQMLAGIVRGFATDIVHGAVVAADPHALELIRSGPAARRAELEAAIGAAGDAPLWFAFAPTADNRRVVAETMPLLPPRLGGGPSAVLTQGVRWSLVSATLSPAPAVRAVAQSEDATAAAALKEWMTAMLQDLPDGEKARGARPLAELVASAIRPEVRGTQVLISPQADDVRAVLAEALGMARARARFAASKSRLHNIGLGVLRYRADHDDQWPENLQQVLEAGHIRPNGLSNPRLPGQGVGYMYRKTTAEPGAQVVIAWEKFDQWPDAGVSVLYADMHIATVRNQQRFEEIVQAGR